MLDIGSHIPLNLGDVVDFGARDYEFGLTTLTIKKGNSETIYKTGHTKMIAPAMVVVEVVVEDVKKSTLYDEKSGTALKDPIKVCCQWFSHQTNQFVSRWFNIGVLKKIKDIEFSTENFQLNQIVSLRTASAHNVQSERIIRQKLAEEVGETSYKISQIYDTTAYLPPKMIVTGIEDSKEEKPLFDKSTGKRKRFASKKLIKGMWYDYKTGKYSEHLFVAEALMLANKLEQDYFLNQFTHPKEEEE